MTLKRLPSDVKRKPTEFTITNNLYHTLFTRIPSYKVDKGHSSALSKHSCPRLGTVHLNADSVH